MSLSIHPLAEIPRIIAPPVRLAGLDIGTKTIGIALSTPDWQMATPLTTIKRGKWAADLAALDKALTGFGVGGLVVGLPLGPVVDDQRDAQVAGRGDVGNADLRAGEDLIVEAPEIAHPALPCAAARARRLRWIMLSSSTPTENAIAA